MKILKVIFDEPVINNGLVALVSIVMTMVMQDEATRKTTLYLLDMEELKGLALAIINKGIGVECPQIISDMLGLEGLNVHE